MTDNVFKIFIGYADDAVEQLNMVKGLKPRIDEYIQKEINTIRNPIYGSCDFFDWKEDASSSIGGQIDKINSNILDSQLCLFLFNKRIGETTKKEIDISKRDNKRTICLFPDKKKLFSILEELEEEEENIIRNIQTAYKKSLTADWNDENSKSITPTQLYNDSNLCDIVFEKVKSIIQEFHRLSRNNEIHLEIQEIKNLYLSVPPLPIEYLPRTYDLENMKKVLMDNKNAKIAITSVSKVLGLYGMGGIGKSIFAIALAHDLDVKKYFEDGIYFLTLGHKPNINEIQKELITYLYEETTECTTAKIKRILSNKKVLLIIDDIWDIKHLNFFNVINDESKLIITTRQQNIVTACGAKDYSIDILTLAQSRKLLEKKVGSISKDLTNLTNNIIKKCGFLPLAINIVGSILKGKDIEWWNDVQRDLDEARLENIEFSNVNEQHESLYKAIQLSVNYLEEKYKKRYLDLSVFSNSQKIPQITLKIFWGEEYLKTIKLLTDSSLLFEEKENNSKYYYLHDLQNDFIRSLEKNLKIKYIKLLKKYEEYYNDWVKIPILDTFFYNNYMEICNIIEDDNLSNIISKEIFYNKKDINYSLFTKLKRNLSLSKDDLVNFSKKYLINDADSLDNTLTVACIKILGKDNEHVLNFIEKYINTINFNHELLSSCLKMLEKERKNFKNFAIRYIKRETKTMNSALTITCLNLLRDKNNEKDITSFAKNYINSYDKNSNSDLFNTCLNILGSNNNQALFFAEKYIERFDDNTNLNILAGCLKVLGKNNNVALKFANEYFKLKFNDINSAVSKECFKIVDNNYIYAIKYAEEYIQKKDENSFVYNDCFLYLGKDNNKNIISKNNKKNRNGINVL